jgi:ketosteroid isomerase-like protein
MDSVMAARSVLIVAALLATQNLSAQSVLPVNDSAAVKSTVRAFHEALVQGDSTAALRLLASDAVILENGDQETREEYSSHHLAADIEFAKAVPARLRAMQVTVNGDVAWASSTTVTQGTYRGQAINSTGAELIVLSRAATGWEIRSIHWSSHKLRSGH